MRCSSRPSRTGKTGNGRRRGASRWSLSCSASFPSSASTAAPRARLALRVPRRRRRPHADAVGLGQFRLAAGATVTDLGSNFLERLGNQASHGFGNTLRNNPGGGGASEATDTPLRFRTWGEAYGISTTTSAQGAFVGDHRQTYGGVAGLGATSRPASMSVFRSTRAEPPSTFRWRCSRRRSTSLSSASTPRWTRGLDLGRGAGPWRRQDQFQPRHRLWPRHRRLQRSDRRCADRTQLLLESGPEPHRAEGRVRICALLDRRVSGNGRSRSGDGGRHHRSNAHGFCSAPRSGTTGSSTRRFSICPPTANSSTMSRRISVRSWSASARRASPCKASAKASMAPMSVRRLPQPDRPDAPVSSTMTASSAPRCSRIRALLGVEYKW